MSTDAIVVPAALAGERVDRVVSLLTGLSRADAASLVSAGVVAIDGAPATARSRRLKEGDRLEVDLAEAAAPGPARRPLPDAAVSFGVVHEDADVVVVDKPSGLVTHPGAGNTDGTLVGGLLVAYPELAELPAAGFGGVERPGIVHRLDKETSGLLVVARSARAYSSLTAQLASRTMGRRYAALVVGEMSAGEGVVDAPIGRSERDRTRMAVSATGRSARTRYRVVTRFSEPVAATHLELELETGRTHQIRVHLAAIGHPVLGDRRYGGVRGAARVSRLMLHARSVSFEHPADGRRVRYDSALPADVEEALSRFA